MNSPRTTIKVLFSFTQFLLVSISGSALASYIVLEKLQISEFYGLLGYFDAWKNYFLSNPLLPLLWFLGIFFVLFTIKILIYRNFYLGMFFRFLYINFLGILISLLLGLFVPLGIITYVVASNTAEIQVKLSEYINTNESDIDKFINDRSGCITATYYDPAFNNKIGLEYFKTKMNTGLYISQVFTNEMLSVAEFDSSEHNVFLYNDTLYLMDIEDKSFEKYGLALAKRMTSCLFDDKELRDPKKADYDLVTQEEYLRFRKTQIQKQISSLDTYIRYLDSKIREINSLIAQGNIFLKRGYDAKIASLIKQAEDLLVVYQKERTRSIDYRNQLTAETQKVGGETGVFYQPNTIKVIHPDDTDEVAFQVVSVTVHEYLHYTSLEKGNRLPDLFNEGLTEMYEVDIRRANGLRGFGTSYAIPVYICRLILEKVPEETIRKIYLTQDDSLLKKVLDENYGSGFYDKNLNVFNRLAYDTSASAIQEANELSTSMGGIAITDRFIEEYDGVWVDKPLPN